LQLQVEAASLDDVDVEGDLLVFCKPVLLAMRFVILDALGRGEMDCGIFVDVQLGADTCWDFP